MSGMREKDAVRLSGINQPGHFNPFFHILGHKFGFFRITALRFFMAFDALSELGYSGIATVFTEKVAAFAAIAHKATMKGMVEVNGLLFFENRALLGRGPTPQSDLPQARQRKTK